MLTLLRPRSGGRLHLILCVRSCHRAHARASPGSGSVSTVSTFIRPPGRFYPFRLFPRLCLFLPAVFRGTIAFRRFCRACIDQFVKDRSRLLVRDGYGASGRIRRGRPQGGVKFRQRSPSVTVARGGKAVSRQWRYLCDCVNWVLSSDKFLLDSKHTSAA